MSDERAGTSRSSASTSSIRRSASAAIRARRPARSTPSRTTPGTTSSTSTSARLQRVHLALPHRRHRQLAAGRARSDAYTLEEQLSWDSLPPQREIDAERKPQTAGRRRADHGARNGGPGRHGGAALVGRASVRQPLHDREAGDRHGHRQLPADGRRRVERHPPHRARFRRHVVSRARRTDDRHRSSRARSDGQAAPRAPVFGREPARGRASALQQPRADGEARHRGSRRPSRARASHRTTCATSRKARRSMWWDRTARPS